MQAVITHPDGVEEGLSDDVAQKLVATTPSELGQVIRNTGKLTASERLNIYGSAYYARLIECLEASYPGLLHALEEEAFDALAFAYLQEYPSHSYTLNELGTNFPLYLEKNRPDWDDDENLRDLPDFMVDLARLEWTLGEVFDSEGDEGLPLLNAEDVRDMPPSSFANATLKPARSLRLLTTRFPVNVYLQAVRDGQEPPYPTRQQTWMAINRINYEVRRHDQSQTQFELLQAIVDGNTVAEAMATVAERVEDVEALVTDVQAWFAYWTSAGFFTGINYETPS